MSILADILEVGTDNAQPLVLVVLPQAAQPFEGFLLEYVTAKPVRSISRIGDDPTREQYFDTPFNLAWLRILGIYFQDHV